MSCTEINHHPTWLSFICHLCCHFNLEATKICRCAHFYISPVQNSRSLDFCTYTFQTGEPQGTLNPGSPHRATLCQYRLWDWLGRCCPSVSHLHRRSGRGGSVSPVTACRDTFQPSPPMQSGVWHRCWPPWYIHGHYTFILPWVVSFLISLAWFSSCKRSSC